MNVQRPSARPLRTIVNGIAQTGHVGILPAPGLPPGQSARASGWAGNGTLACLGLSGGQCRVPHGQRSARYLFVRFPGDDPCIAFAGGQSGLLSYNIKPTPSPRTIIGKLLFSPEHVIPFAQSRIGPFRQLLLSRIPPARLRIGRCSR